VTKEAFGWCPTCQKRFAERETFSNEAEMHITMKCAEGHEWRALLLRDRGAGADYHYIVESVTVLR
jgi:hypothetical protein